MNKNFSWSYSALNNYETCPSRYYHYSVAKDVTEPEGQAISDGNQLHAAFDARLRKNIELPLGMGHHEGLLTKVLNAPGQTYSERKLAISSSFTPVAYFSDDAWYRGILDCTKINGSTASVLDWKTGKPYPDHTQLKLASALVFHSAPNINHVNAALVYVNYDKIEKVQYDREDLITIWAEIMPRVKKLQKARETNNYPPKPGFLCRKYCAVMSCPHYGIG